MNNIEKLMDAWQNAETVIVGKLRTDGEHIYSYDQCIVAWDEDANFGEGVSTLNMTKYSATTTRHQRAILKWFQENRQFAVRVATPPATARISSDWLKAVYDAVPLAEWEAKQTPAAQPEPPMTVDKTSGIYAFDERLGW